MDIAIQCKGLTKKYATQTALQNITFSVKQGELFALLGVNGAGKTTLIRLLCCLSKPTAGEAFLFGHSIRTAPQQVKSFLAISPQETAIAPQLTVRENLRLMAAAYHLKGQQQITRVEELLHLFELKKIENRRSKTLSGGWQRRLSIAMAFINKPKIIFLDEPTLGLDVLARQALWEMIEKIKGNATVILTTHYLEEVQSLADRVCIMKNGAIQALGTIEALQQQTKTTNFNDAFVQIVTQPNLTRETST